MLHSTSTDGFRRPQTWEASNHRQVPRPCTEVKYHYHNVENVLKCSVLFCPASVSKSIKVLALKILEVPKVSFILHQRVWCYWTVWITLHAAKFFFVSLSCSDWLRVRSHLVIKSRAQTEPGPLEDRSLVNQRTLSVSHQIAVDNGFGGVYGQQKADWMVDVVQQYFHDNGR